MLLLLAAAPLTFEAAWQEALQHNPTLQAAQADVDGARALESVPWLQNPELEVQADTVPDEGELTVTGTVTQPVTVPIALWARQAAAGQQRTAAQARLEQAQAELAADIETALATLAAAGEALTLRGHLHASALARAEALRQRAVAGNASPADARNAAIDSAAALALQSRSEAEVEQAVARLCALLGRSPCGSLEVVWPAVAAPRDDVEALRIRAQLQRGDTRAARSIVQAREEEHTAAAWERLPPVGVGVGVGFDRTRIGAVADNDWQVGAVLRMDLPVFDRGQRELFVADAARSGARAQAQRIELDADAEVRAAFASAHAAARAWDAQHAVAHDVDTALHELESAQAQGALALDTFLLARDRLVQVRLQSVETHKDAVAAQARLRAALGRLPEFDSLAPRRPQLPSSDGERP